MAVDGDQLGNRRARRGGTVAAHGLLIGGPDLTVSQSATGLRGRGGLRGSAQSASRGGWRAPFPFQLAFQPDAAVRPDVELAQTDR